MKVLFNMSLNLILLTYPSILPLFENSILAGVRTQFIDGTFCDLLMKLPMSRRLDDHA
jgi:hypothetical protein